MIGSSFPLSCEIVQEGVMRRSDETRGAEEGVGEGTVIRRETSGAVWRDIVLNGWLIAEFWRRSANLGGTHSSLRSMS